MTIKKRKPSSSETKRQNETHIDGTIQHSCEKYKNITEKLLERLEKLQYERGYAAGSMERFYPVVECGTISTATGNPRTVPVRGHYRSLPRRGKARLPDRIAILTKTSRLVDGYQTRLLEINRESFRLDKYGLRHSSGAFFALDAENYQRASNFLCGVAI